MGYAQSRPVSAHGEAMLMRPFVRRTTNEMYRGACKWLHRRWLSVSQERASAARRAHLLHRGPHRAFLLVLATGDTCHSTQPLTAIDCQSLKIYTVIFLPGLRGWAGDQDRARPDPWGYPVWGKRSVFSLIFDTAFSFATRFWG